MIPFHKIKLVLTNAVELYHIVSRKHLSLEVDDSTSGIVNLRSVETNFSLKKERKESCKYQVP